MKILCPVLFLFLLGTCASAQTLSNPSDVPNVTVVEKRWRMEVRPRAIDKDIFKAIKDREQEVLDQKETARQNENRIKQGLPTLPPPVRVPTTERRSHGVSVTYLYEVKVKNTAEKEIRTLIWDYVFFEPGTERELGRRRFVSEVRIGGGKTKKVIMRLETSPTGTIDATKVGIKEGDQYSERVVIRGIEYADRSVWPAASK